jgi:hypothetical protein
VVVASLCLQLGVERRDDPADERLVPVPWEGRVAEQHEPVVTLPGTQQPPVTPQQVRDVVGDERPPLALGMLQDRQVVAASEVSQLGLLHGDDVVAAEAQLGGDDGGDHLFQQQPHPSNDRSTS